MHILIDIGIIVACCVALAKGADLLVESAARIAKRIGMSQLVVGLTIVAFGTSAPEFAVTVSAALNNHADISVANVVGSNIFNLGFILGGCAILYAIETDKYMIWRDGTILVLITLFLIPLLSDLEISRFEGASMFALLVAYLAYLFFGKRSGEADVPEGSAQWHDVPIMLVGLALIIAGGQFLVESAVELARFFGLSEWIIGATIIAAGTSLPELVTSLVAIHKKHSGISAGNLIGSNIFNTLGVLGAAGMIRPLAVDAAAMESLIALSGFTVLVVIMMRTGWKLSRFEGIMLVITSLFFWIYAFAGR